MEHDAALHADEAQSTETEAPRAGAFVLGTVLSVWAGLRDAYYGGIDVIERAVCAP